MGEEQNQAIPNIVNRCARGDSEAWELFLKTFHNRIAVFAMRDCRSAMRHRADQRERVAEVVQEVYVKLLAHDCRALRTWRGSNEGSFLGYLASIVHSTVRDLVKRDASQKRGAPTVSLDEEMPDCSDLPALQVAAPQGSDPEFLFEQAMAPRRLREMLAKVETGPNATRNSLIFQLHALDGLSAKEIAALPHLGLTVTAVETVLHRTREKLRIVSRGSFAR